MHNIRASLKEFYRNAFRFGLYSSIGQIISMIALPLLGRLYTPASFGNAGLITVFCMMCLPIITGRLEHALVSARSDSEAGTLFLSGLILTLFMSIVATSVYVALTVFGIGAFGELPVIAFPLVLASLIITGISTLIFGWGLRNSDFDALSRINLWQSITRNGIQLVLGVVIASWVSLIVGEIAGTLSGVRRLMTKYWAVFYKSYKYFSIQQSQIIINKYKSYFMFSIPSGLLDNIAFNLVIPIVTTLYGAEHGGQYFLLQRLVRRPMALFSTSVAHSFHATLSRQYREKPQFIKYNVYATFIHLCYLGAIASSLLWFALTLFWNMLLGNQWETARRLLTIMVPAIWAESVISPISRILTLPSYQHNKLIFDLLFIVSMILSSLVSWKLDFSLYKWQLLLTGLTLILYSVYGWIIFKVATSISAEVRADAE